MRRENKFISQTVRLVHIQGGLSLIPFFLSRPFPLYISFGNVGGVVAHQHINSNRRNGEVAELVYAVDLKSTARERLGVQVPSSPP